MESTKLDRSDRLEQVMARYRRRPEAFTRYLAWKTAWLRAYRVELP